METSPLELYGFMNYYNFHLYQAIVAFIAAFMIFQGVRNYLKGKSGQTFYKVAIRIIVWGGMAFIAIFPGFTNALAKIVGLQGNVNAVIITGFILVFMMIFKLLSAIEKLEQDISILTRKDSLKEIQKK